MFGRVRRRKPQAGNSKHASSIPRALGFVVEAFIPFEFADHLKQAFRLAAGNEFFESLGDRGLLGALAAYLQSPFEQIGIDRQVCRHV